MSQELSDLYRSAYGLFVVETAQTALITSDAFQWFVYGFGNMLTLSKPFTTFVDNPIMDGVIALVVQFFFAWRIWVRLHILKSSLLCLIIHRRYFVKVGHCPEQLELYAYFYQPQIRSY